MTTPIPDPDTLILPVSTADHSYGWVAVGGPGECGASCSCGVTFDGFDTIGEATAQLDGHLADSPPPPVLPTVTLAYLVDDAEHVANLLITALSRQYDPESAPAVDGPTPGYPLVDVHLGVAVNLVRRVQGQLREITELSETGRVPA